MTTVEPEPAPSFWKRVFEYLDRKANPVLLRDLRLYMRGKMMITAYFLTLAILVLAAIAYAMAARWGGMDGGRLLYIPTYLLAIICGALVPNLVGERFRSELSSRATELALVSPLTPARLVRGKLMGAWAMSLLVVSASMPVLATAYLLGGVNPYDILGTVAGILLAGAAMPLPQLYLATGVRQKGSGRILFGLLFAGNIVLMLGYASLLYYTFSSYSYYSARRHSFYTLYAVAVAGVLVAQFLYFVTVSRLRGEAENRDAAPRLSLAAAALLGAAGAVAMFLMPDVTTGLLGGVDWEEMLGVAAFPVSLAFCWGVFVLSNGNAAKPRTLRDEGRGGLLRRAFLMPGPGSLAAYFVLISAFILLLGRGGFDGSLSSGYDRDRLRMFCLTMSPIMFIAYGLVVYRFLVRPFLRARPGPTMLPNVILITNIALAIAAVFVMVILGPFEDDLTFYPYLLGLTPTGLFTAASSRDMMEGAAAAGFIVLVVLFLLLILAGSGRRPERWSQEERRDAA